MPPARLLITAGQPPPRNRSHQMPPAVDQAGATHVAVRYLVAAKVDGVVAGKIGVNTLVELAVTGIADVERQVAAVIFGELLFDDIGLYRDAEVIGLPGRSQQNFLCSRNLGPAEVPRAREPQMRCSESLLSSGCGIQSLSRIGAIGRCGRSISTSPSSNGWLSLASLRRNLPRRDPTQMSN